MDFQDLASRLGIDEDDFMELVELFVTTTRSDIEKIKNGINNASSEEAAAASHSIKGAAGNLGFDSIYELAKQMEMKAKSGDLEEFDALIADLEAHVDAFPT